MGSAQGSLYSARDDAGATIGYEDRMAEASADAAEGATGAATESPIHPAEEISERESLLFDLTTGALYHRSREMTLAWLHRATMFVNIFAGTGAVVAFAKDKPDLAIGISFIVALASSANLAFDLAGGARRHAEHRRTYHDLAADLEEAEEKPSLTRRLRGRMIRAAGKEPAVFEAALADAYNAAIQSLGRDANYGFHLTGWQYALRHAWPYRGTKFPFKRDVPIAAPSRGLLQWLRILIGR
jgi:hypothetical protein